MENNTLATVNNTSIAKMSFEERKNLFNAVTSAEHKVSDYVNRTITIANVLFTRGSLTNEDTGEIETVERAILIDTEGNTYHTMSNGLLNSLHSLCFVFGEPKEWDNPIAVTVIKKDTKKGQTYILEIV